MPTVNILAFNIYGSGDNVHVTNQDNDIYIAVDATGIASVNTGELTGAFYPRYANPKGYITQTWLNGLASSGDILIASGSLQSQIDNLNVIPIETGNFVTNDVLDGVEANLDNQIANLKSQTGVFLTNLNGTGVLTNAFYPLNANPANYLTNLNGTGALLNVFYPLSNPAGYITGFDTSIFALKNQTGQFVTNNQILNLVNKSETGSFVTFNQITPLSPISYVNSVSGNLQGQINSIPSVNTGSLTNVFYPLKGNPSGFVMSKSGVLITDGFGVNIKNGELLIGSAIDNSFIQGNIIGANGISIVSGAGSLVVSFTGVTNVNTGSLVNAFYPLNSNPSNYATTSYVNNVSGALASQLGGSGSQVKVTGSNTIASPNFVGIGSTKLIISGSTVLVSGNSSGAIPTGNFAQVTSGSVTMAGGATISNGDLLIGNASDNSFTQGKLNAGSGISITSGAASLTISCTVAPTQQVTQNNNLLPIRTLGASYTVTTGDLVINPMTFVYTGNASGTITLPAANLTSGKVIVCKQGGLGNLTVSSSSQIYTTGNSFGVLLVSGDCLAFHSSSSKYWAH